MGPDPLIWQRFLSAPTRSVWAMTSGDALAGRGMRLLHDAVDALRCEHPAGQPSAALGADILGLQQAIGQLTYELSQRAAAFDSAGGALADGMPTTASWIRHRANLPAGEASMLVKVGRDLRD